MRLRLFWAAGAFAIGAAAFFAAVMTNRDATGPQRIAAPASHDATAFEPPDVPLLFGYFYADGRYGDYWNDLRPSTNVYVVCPSCYDRSGNWKAALAHSVARAADAGQSLVVLADDRDDWEAIVEITAPFWHRVRWVEIAHEAKIRRATMDARAQAWKTIVRRRGLSQKPLAAMQALCQTWQLLRCAWWDGWTSPALDFVGIEAYPPLPDSGPRPSGLPFPVDDENGHVTANLSAILTRAEARLAPHQRLYLAMMAYDRNGAWTSETTLSAIQYATYTWARSRKRVAALLAFAYSRPGGLLTYPTLKQGYDEMGRAILQRQPEAGDER